MALTQGFLIRRLLPKWGERGLLTTGFFLFTVAMTLIGFSSSVFLMAIAMTLLALGSGFINPAMNGTLSILAGPQEQGEVLGVSQSLAALARILGPPLGGYLYQSFAPSAPFLMAGLMGFIGLSIIYVIRKKIPQSSLVG